MRPQPPKTTLFPYTTLFRSALAAAACGLALTPAAAQTARPAANGNFDFVGWDAYLGGSDSSQFSALTQIDKANVRSEEHTSELQSRFDLVCRLLLEKKKKTN